MLLALGLTMINPSAFSQDRFNVRYNVEPYPSTILTSVLELQDGYSTLGTLIDTVESVNGRVTVFSKFDSVGEALFHKTYGGVENGPDRWLNSANDDLAFLNDSTLISSVRSIDENDIHQYLLFKYNLDGDTVSSMRFYSPTIDQDDFVGIAQVVKSSDSNLLLRVNNSTGFFGTGGDFFIEKLTPEGESLWQYLYATPQSPDYNYVLIPTDSGGAIIIPSLIDEDETPVINHLVIELDSIGQLVHNEVTDFDYSSGSIRDALLDNQHLVAVSTLRNGEEQEYHPALVKMTMDGEPLWHVPAWPGDFNYWHRGKRVIKTQDGQYLLGGDYRTDVEGGFNWHQQDAFLSKYSTDGEVLWHRKYTFLDSERHHHTLQDLEPTSDGGYIFCGESRDDTSEAIEPTQQGWLVKLDQYGCLVEGCHLSDNIEEQAADQKYFKAGPNPAADFLNIYQTKALDNSHTYQLHDIKGNLLEHFPAADFQTTFMLPVHQYASGTYILSLLENGSPLQREKVILH